MKAVMDLPKKGEKMKTKTITRASKQVRVVRSVAPTIKAAKGTANLNKSRRTALRPTISQNTQNKSRPAIPAKPSSSKPMVPTRGVSHKIIASIPTIERAPITAAAAAAAAAPVHTETRQPYDENTALRLYLRDAVEVDLLTPDQEIQLARRIQKGDDVAREHMIRANLRLVIKIAREYEDFGLPLLDLINEGNIGLMRAVERFDPDRGAKLSTYAAWWIKQSIKRALSNQSKAIRLPIHIVQELARMRKAEARLEADLGRAPSDAELAAELEADVEDIQRWREAAAVGATSLDAPLGNDSEASRVADVIADENAVMPWSEVSAETDAQLLRELVGTLNAREQLILKRRFALEGGDPETLETIGEDFGLTRERIRQLEAAALKKLRDRMRSREARKLAA